MAYQMIDDAHEKNGEETRLAPGTSEGRSVDVLLSVQRAALLKRCTHLVLFIKEIL